MAFPSLGAPVTYRPHDGSDGRLAGLITGHNADGSWRLIVFPPNALPVDIDSTVPGSAAGDFDDALNPAALL